MLVGHKYLTVIVLEFPPHYFAEHQTILMFSKLSICVIFHCFCVKLCQKCLFGNLWNKGSCCFWNVSSTDWWWASNYSDWQPTSHSNVKMGRSFYSRAIQLFPEGFHECENFENFREIHVVCSLVVFREYFFFAQSLMTIPGGLWRIMKTNNPTQNSFPQFIWNSSCGGGTLSEI